MASIFNTATFLWKGKGAGHKTKSYMRRAGQGNRWFEKQKFFPNAPIHLACNALTDRYIAC